MPGMSSDILQGSMHNIRHQSNSMKQQLNDGNLLQALKHCANFLNELRTSNLSPKQYYEIYMAVFDNLEILSTNLLASYKSKQKNRPAGDYSPFLADLYELVQYSGNVLPRLYLMIVVGSTYMAFEGSPAKEIMKDMLEMCSGVQHPIRGLFLRYYLSQRTKDILPISKPEDFGQVVDFLVSNFIEMNKLWVRLQHQGHSSERQLRHEERKELKILVGFNLVRLSQIMDDYTGDESFSSLEFYKKEIFPIVVEQIIQCRDPLAQTYLVDVIIQVFPGEFHFATLNELLNVFLHLNPILRKSELVANLIERCITYHKFESDATLEHFTITQESKDLDTFVNALFESFWNFYGNLKTNEPDLPAEEHSKILKSYVELALAFEQFNHQNLDSIYKEAHDLISHMASKGMKNNEEEEAWLELIMSPIKGLRSFELFGKLSYVYELYQSLSLRSQKEVSKCILDKLLDSSEKYGAKLLTIEEIESVFKYLKVLIDDSDDDLNSSKDLGLTDKIKFSGSNLVFSYDYLNVHERICKTFHLVNNEDYLKNITNLIYINKKYLNKNSQSLIHTYPALISKVLFDIKIAGLINLRTKNDSAREIIINHIRQLTVIISEFYLRHSLSHLKLVLQLYLDSASLADQLRLGSLAFELFNESLVVFEENLMMSSNSQAILEPYSSIGGSTPYELIISIANKVLSLRFLCKADYEALTTKITLYGSKMLRKQDQCRTVYYCAHFWWWTEPIISEESPVVTETDLDQSGVEDKAKEGEGHGLYHVPKRVLECLQKSLKTASVCLDPQLSLRLFVEVLNRCLIFHEYGNGLVDSEYINGLIELIRTNIENLTYSKNQSVLDDEEKRIFEKTNSYFKRTLAHINNVEKNY